MRQREQGRGRPNSQQQSGRQRRDQQQRPRSAWPRRHAQHGQDDPAQPNVRNEFRARGQRRKGRQQRRAETLQPGNENDAASYNGNPPETDAVVREFQRWQALARPPSNAPPTCGRRQGQQDRARRRGYARALRRHAFDHANGPPRRPVQTPGSCTPPADALPAASARRRAATPATPAGPLRPRGPAPAAARAARAVAETWLTCPDWATK